MKKQSQFAAAKIGVTSFVKGDYGNMSACGVEENKANQSQLLAFSGQRQNELRAFEKTKPMLIWEKWR